MTAESVTQCHSAAPKLAVVIIGRNEGERLRRCLLSVASMRKPVGGIECIYVDTASQDGSPEMAEAVGIPVIRLFPDDPSAALARNAGWRAVSAPFVLFLDGDCQIDRDFAVEALARFENPQIAIVWGRLREAYPEASLYNRLMDVQWVCLRSLPEGPCFYGTGIGIVRRAALEAVDGFDNRMINGQNTDLGRRVQKLGFIVFHVALPMVRHDAEMLRFAHYWRRFFREGHSYARLQDTFRTGNQPLFRFEFSPLGGAFMLFGPFLALLGSLLFGSWIILAIATLILIVLVVRTTMRYRFRAFNLSNAILFSLHWHIKLIPNFLGHVAYRMDELTGRRRKLMEYRRD